MSWTSRSVERSGTVASRTDSLAIDVGDEAAARPRSIGAIGEVSAEKQGREQSPKSLQTMELSTVSDGDIPFDATQWRATLDDLLPADSLLGDTHTFPEPEVITASPAPPESAITTVAGVTSDRDSSPAIDSDQTIRLPPIRDKATETVAFASEVESLRLEFPVGVPFELGRGTRAESWLLRASVDANPIAELRAEGGATRFRWTNAAARVGGANRLIYGRLVNEQGDQRYLRPVVEAEPIALEFAEQTSEKRWDLAGPIPFPATELAMKVEAADGIDVAWIEPIEGVDPRRGRGTAMVCLTDAEDVAVGLQCDYRCTRELAITVRYAARLDAELPWQAISRWHVEQTEAVLTTRLTAVKTQSESVKRLWTRADAAERAILQPRRVAIARTRGELELIASRLAELNELMNEVERGCSLRISLTTQWPDARQPILRMPPGEPDAQ